jgi:hypothetical protein
MFRGLLTLPRQHLWSDSHYVEKTDESFPGILQQMEVLKKEYIGQNIESIDIYEDNKVVAALRTI